MSPNEITLPILLQGRIIHASHESIREVMTLNSIPEIPAGVKAHPAKAQELEVRFLRVSQFSRVTSMPQPTVFRFIQTGELKAYRRGRSLFIPIEEVDRFIAADAA